jgi:transcriptional regulator with XRE-family HTH domain
MRELLSERPPQAPADAPGLILCLLERGWSQAEIARRLPASPRSVSDWAQGKRQPDKRHMAMLARLVRAVLAREQGQE